MYPVYSGDMMTAAVEMVTCFFTIAVAFMSYLLAWRA
jgi:hypothetical protein